MKTCWLRQLLSLALVLSFSCAGWGLEGSGARAVLHTSGKVQVNGNDSRQITTTLFSGDVIQTDEESAANIIAGGSSVLVMPGAAVKFLGNKVELTQGSMAIATSEAMTATVDDVIVTPVAQRLSKFEVAEDEDTVVIVARQGSVAVSDGQQTSTVQEGQESRRRRKKKGGGAIPGGIAGILIAENGKKKCLSASGNKTCVCKKDKNGVDSCEIQN